MDAETIEFWNKILTRKLKNLGMPPENINSMIVIISDQREDAYNIGYQEGYNDGMEHQESLVK